MRKSRTEFRFNGHVYTSELTKQRQFVNGVERLAVVDHQSHEIRFSSKVRDIVVKAISAARSTAPTPEPTRVLPLGPLVIVSGCFPVHRLLWPWEVALQ